MIKKITSFKFSKTNLIHPSQQEQIFANPIFKANENLAMKQLPPIPSVSIIRTADQARRVVSILKNLKDRYHAWDTETIGVDPKIQSPATHGNILCMSCFVGPDIDFGNGPSKFYFFIKN